MGNSKENFEKLPDTLSQPYQSQEHKIVEFKLPWGRLYSCVNNLKSIDLVENCINLGRAPSCSIIVSNDNFPLNIWMTISKVHFTIIRDEYTDLVYLKDESKNGTFLNSRLVGKGKRNILQHDDILSIGTGGCQKLFIFKNLNSDDSEKNLPVELRTKYKRSRFLGKGACGEVHLLFDKTTTKAYALKKIKKGTYSSDSSNHLNHPHKIMTEIDILKALSHPCVIKMRDIIETKEDVYLILEYMAGGDLSKRINTNLLETERDVKLIFYQITDAVRYLHNIGITHRDLKPDNILLASKAKETLIKITDFGLSKLMEETCMSTICGTPTYVAPEVIDGSYDAYSNKVDVWSAGVLLFYMLSKELPFRAPDRNVLNGLIMRGQFNMKTSKWMSITNIAKDLVRKMLEISPDKRYSMNDVWQHYWLQKDVSIKRKVTELVQSCDFNSDYFVDSTEYDNDEPPKKQIKLIESSV